MTLKEAGDYVFVRGKFKGWTMREVAEKHPYYVHYCARVRPGRVGKAARIFFGFEAPQEET